MMNELEQEAFELHQEEFGGTMDDFKSAYDGHYPSAESYAEEWYEEHLRTSFYSVTNLESRWSDSRPDSNASPTTTITFTPEWHREDNKNKRHFFGFCRHHMDWAAFTEDLRQNYDHVFLLSKNGGVHVFSQ
jgi:hypothetical protein